MKKNTIACGLLVISLIGLSTYLLVTKNQVSVTRESKSLTLEDFEQGVECSPKITGSIEQDWNNLTKLHGNIETNSGDPIFELKLEDAKLIRTNIARQTEFEVTKKMDPKFKPHTIKLRGTLTQKHS